MQNFLQAHGYDPGPTQRPILAGALTGLAATIPATAVLAAFGSITVEAAILRLSVPATLGAGCAAMMLAGALYGALFRRAANDRHGGWLLGMAFGFLIWSAGAMLILWIISGGLVPGGEAATGVLLSLLAWGAVLGAAFPHIHSRVHASLSDSQIGKSSGVGPEAAVARGQSKERRPRRRPERPERPA
jgi:hypothetical protein